MAHESTLMGMENETAGVSFALSRLSPEEREQLQKATNGDFGGAKVLEPLRSKAVPMGLVYSSTGRLRPNTYKLLLPRSHIQPDKPVIIRR